MKMPNWSIGHNESQGLWIAESDTGVKVYADRREKLTAWLDGRECRIAEAQN